MIDALSKLLGSEARVKLLRLFLQNHGQGFDLEKLTSRTKITARSLRPELKLLESVGFIRRKKFFIEVTKKHKHRPPLIHKKRVQGWFFEESFPYARAFKALVVDSAKVVGSDLSRLFRHVGRLRLLVVGGMFLNDETARLDLMLVADGLKQAEVERAMRELEAEMGHELNYAAFDTKNFRYRVEMFDHLISEVLASPHKKIVDNLNFRLPGN